MNQIILNGEKMISFIVILICIFSIVLAAVISYHYLQGNLSKIDPESLGSWCLLGSRLSCTGTMCLMKSEDIIFTGENN